MGLFSMLFGIGKAREARRKAEQGVTLTRLLTPQWDVVAGHLKRPVPEVVRSLYANKDLITSFDLLVLPPGVGEDRNAGWNVNEFVPADLQSIVMTMETIPYGTLCFATNEYGDPYYVQVGAAEDGDGPVYVRYHDGGDTELVAPSLKEFLSWNREPRMSP
jgi:hypothetical protein